MFSDRFTKRLNIAGWLRWSSCLLFATGFETRGQGYFKVTTDNLVVPPVKFRIFDQDGRTPLFGADFSAQLYAGPVGTPEGALQPVGSPQSFDYKDGQLPDYTIRHSVWVQVATVPVGEKAQVQLRAWDNRGGTIMNWESATVRGSSRSWVPARPLAGGSPETAPGLEGMGNFQLLPATPVSTPLTATYAEAYFNDTKNYPPGTPSKGVTEPLALSADGRTLLAWSIPAGTTVRQLQVQRRLRGAATLSAPEVVVPAAEWGQWEFVAVAGDGAGVLLNRRGGPEAGAAVWRAGTFTRVALANARGWSGDGRKVFGLDAANRLVRLDLDSGEVVPLTSALGNVPDRIQVSHDGRRAVLERWPVDGQTGQVVWQEGVGFILDALPAGFSAAALSGDGQTVVGQRENRPAFVSLTEAPARFSHVGESPTDHGAVWAVSFDGSVMCGELLTARGRFEVFTPAGKLFRINELLPGTKFGTTTRPHAQLRGIQALHLSRDGRVVFGVAEKEDSSGNIGWFADLALPEDGPALVVQRTPPGLSRFAFPTRAGFRYQVERRTGLSASDAWMPHGAALEGDGQEHLEEAGVGGESAFFRLVVTPNSP